MRNFDVFQYDFHGWSLPIRLAMPIDEIVWATSCHLLLLLLQKTRQAASSHHLKKFRVPGVCRVHKCMRFEIQNLRSRKLQVRFHSYSSVDLTKSPHTTCPILHVTLSHGTIRLPSWFAESVSCLTHSTYSTQLTHPKTKTLDVDES